MTRSGVEQLLYLMDQAFDGSGEHSLLANLRSVTADDWSWAPTDGGRTILELTRHVGKCKFVYDNHAFGDRSMRWDLPETVPNFAPDAAKADVIDWLRKGQQGLRDHVAALDDDELLVPRRANWGQDHETRWLISVMIEHDLYHAGEINHLRAVRQGDDRWAWPPT
ncbi:MAG: DinB family protein [Dehalococcoidia bacterium]